MYTKPYKMGGHFFLDANFLAFSAEIEWPVCSGSFACVKSR